MATPKAVPPPIKSAAAAEKGGFNSFMEKEIHDQPAAVRAPLLGRFDEQGKLTLDEVRIDESILKSIDKIIYNAMKQLMLDNESLLGTLPTNFSRKYS